MGDRDLAQWCASACAWADPKDGYRVTAHQLRHHHQKLLQKHRRSRGLRGWLPDAAAPEEEHIEPAAATADPTPSVVHRRPSRDGQAEIETQCTSDRPERNYTAPTPGSPGCDTAARGHHFTEPSGEGEPLTLSALQEPAGDYKGREVAPLDSGPRSSPGKQLEQIKARLRHQVDSLHSTREFAAAAHVMNEVRRTVCVFLASTVFTGWHYVYYVSTHTVYSVSTKYMYYY